MLKTKHSILYIFFAAIFAPAWLALHVTCCRCPAAHAMASSVATSAGSTASGPFPLQSETGFSRQRKSPAETSATSSFVSQGAQSFVEAVERVRHETLLEPAFKSELSHADPEALAHLRTWCGLLLQVMLFVLYISLDIANSMTMSFAMKRPKVQQSSLALATSATSLALAVLVTVVVEEGHARALVRHMADLRQVVALGMVGVLFSFSVNFQVLAYSSDLDPGTIKTLGQMRLPVIAFLSQLFLPVRYKASHWFLLLAVTACSLGFYYNSLNVHSRSQQNFEARLPEYCDFPLDVAPSDDLQEMQCLPDGPKPAWWVGLSFAFCWIFIVCLAGVLMEKFLKASAQTPFHVQRISIELFCTLVNVALVFMVPLFIDGAMWNPSKADRVWWSKSEIACLNPPDGPGGYEVMGGQGLFENWDRITLIAFALQIVTAWFGSWMVKRFSSVVQTFAKCMSVVGTVHVSNLTRDCWAESLPFPMYALTIGIFIIGVGFGQIPVSRTAEPSDLPEERLSQLELCSESRARPLQATSR